MVDDDGLGLGEVDEAPACAKVVYPVLPSRPEPFFVTLGDRRA